MKRLKRFLFKMFYISPVPFNEFSFSYCHLIQNYKIFSVSNAGAGVYTATGQIAFVGLPSTKFCEILMLSTRERNLFIQDVTQ